MPDTAKRLFLFVLSAQRPTGDHSPGRRPVIAFCSAPTIETAMSVAQLEIHALGWRAVELQAAKEVDGDPSSEEDPMARRAMIRALGTGFAHLHY